MNEIHAADKMKSLRLRAIHNVVFFLCKKNLERNLPNHFLIFRLQVCPFLLESGWDNCLQISN